MSASVRNTAIGVPRAEVEIGEQLVAALLAAQHPDLAHLPITEAASGWDNVTFRLGEDMAVRLPRRQVAVDLLRNEQLWLPRLTAHLPLPVPAALRVGVPSALYPWPWSLLPWMAGGPADLDPPRADQARVWADFLRALHRPAPPEAPHNPHRGVPLATRMDHLRERLDRLAAATDLITPGVRKVLEIALAAPLDVEPTWLHGDLHARNVLTRDGAFAAVIDWGDMCRGDRASDLASLWMLLPDASARHAAMATYDTTAATWARAAGWAVYYGVMLADSGRINDPRLLAMGEKTLAMAASAD